MAATFAATVVDEWARGGVTDAVVAPGSRSTPMALALARHLGIRVHVQVDERSAGFIALGLGLATERPAVVLTTSGTAAVELHPAVVEADLAGVPLLACTADRPPELHGVGAPQTVDQRGLYGGSVRLALEPGVPREAASGTWRSLAARAVAAATGVPAGPVHLNLAFAEPLLGEAGPLPPARDDDHPWHRPLAAAPGDVVVEELAGRRGVIVAGRGSGDPEAVHALAAALRWPVLADPLSGCRTDRPTTVALFDLLVRAGRRPPEAVVRFGRPPASKVLAGWLAEVSIQVVVDPSGRFADPDRRATHLVAGGLSPVDPAPDDWLASWQEAEAAAEQALDDAVEDGTEPAIARAVVRDLGPEHTLVVASSMPVRDVEWFAAPSPARILANRGANGIDGVISTAVGVALAGGPTVALVGDLAFLHDTNALLGLAGREVDLTIVVIDNDGGGIFSFLPQADDLAAEEFEPLFGTPHGLDLEAIGRAYGVDVRVHRTDRTANVHAHRRLQAAVEAALPDLSAREHPSGT